MSIQAQLDNQAIDMLPKIKKAINSVNDFDSNQMRCYTIKCCLNTIPCLNDKTSDEIAEFQDGLLSHFIRQDWLDNN